MKPAAGKIRLGVNIDHVATLKRLRDTPYPDVVAAANECIAGGADQITVHLREDRRHIVDSDVIDLKKAIKVDLNLEMAATDAMLKFALAIKPTTICLVPEKREERTTEGGLDLTNAERNAVYKRIANEASKKGIRTSFFVEPDPAHVAAAKQLGASAVEIHTGGLCIAHQMEDESRLLDEWTRLRSTLDACKTLGIQINAGHGIDYRIAGQLAALGTIVEFNIGHAIICEAVSCGLREAVKKMKTALTTPPKK
ncbi:MAG: pyridoxine 5'-phosphate synthase [Deltaproteobacteria bacterium]|nr:pyridoxine 5'-phosphate synthase [Deltaproteobacteria bacterium]